MKITEKPWGREELIEHNDNYVVKKLVMNKGHRCSLQYHELKTETFYVLEGRLLLSIGSLNMENKEYDLEEREMLPGASLTVPPFTVHRMKGLEDSVYLEASTTELDDVVRLADDYKR